MVWLVKTTSCCPSEGGKGVNVFGWLVRITGLKYFPRQGRADLRMDDTNAVQLVRIARILSLLEPKVQKRNYSSVE